MRPIRGAAEPEHVGPAGAAAAAAAAGSAELQRLDVGAAEPPVRARRPRSERERLSAAARRTDVVGRLDATLRQTAFP